MVPGARAMACRLCQSCKASTGEVDGVELLLGQAARPTGSPDDRSVTGRIYRDLLRRWLLPVVEDVRATAG